MFKRIPEKEIMEGEQATAYSNADFSEPHNLFVELISKLSMSRECSTILDIGIGDADIAIRLLKRFPKVHITGFDGSLTMLKHAEDKINKNQLAGKIHCRHGFIGDDLINDEKFDLVVSNSVLHHIKQTQLFWRLIKKATKEGGKFFIMDLLRPNSVDAAAALVETYASNESAQLKEDFYNSLLAAYNLNEIEEQLQENSILDFNIQQITDRHFIVFGSMFA